MTEGATHKGSFHGSGNLKLACQLVCCYHMCYCKTLAGEPAGCQQNPGGAEIDRLGRPVNADWPKESEECMAEKTLGRPAVIQEGIYRELRTRLVRGDFLPSVRFPTRRELCREFDASTVTMQVVLERLMADGFVETRGTRGTFVVANPPHLSRYALVFPSLPSSNRFWMALNNVALQLRYSQNVDLVAYYGIDGHSDRREYRQLVDDVEHHRIAGLIFASSPFQLENTPLLDEPGIPRVAISGIPQDKYNCWHVGVDNESFARRAVDLLVEAGRRQIALLLPGTTADIEQDFLDALAASGLTPPAYWRQAVHHGMGSAARNLAHLLVRGPAAERPNALIIANDNLVEAATAGLVDAGIHVPDDLLVIAHCNFPYPPPASTPVLRLGYDGRTILAACIDAIDAQRQGETHERASQRVVAVTADELMPDTDLASRHTGADPMLGTVDWPAALG